MIAQYPANPRELSKPIFTACYGDDVPINKELLGFTRRCAPIPLCQFRSSASGSTGPCLLAVGDHAEAIMAAHLVCPETSAPMVLMPGSAGAGIDQSVAMRLKPPTFAKIDVKAQLGMHTPTVAD